MKILTFVTALFALPAHALDIQQVTDNVFAIVGPLEQRSAAQVAVHLGVSQDEVYQSKSLVLEQIRELLPEMEKVW